MNESVTDKLKLVKEAIDSWEKGELEELSALIVIHMTLFPKKPSEEAMRWAMRTIENKKSI